MVVQYILSHLPILIFSNAGVGSIRHSSGLQGLSHFQILPTLTGTQDSWIYTAGLDCEHSEQEMHSSFL